MARIREASHADLPGITAIYEPYVRDTVISFESQPPDVHEMARRVRSTQERFPWLVLADGNHVLGYAYGGSHRQRAAYRWSVEVSAYIAADAHRRGYGRRLVVTALELLALQGFRMVFAGITMPNAASVGLHEALGFERVGIYPRVGFKFGAWHDVGWWSRPLGSPTRSPTEPARPEALRTQDSWQRLLDEMA